MKTALMERSLIFVMLDPFEMHRNYFLYMDYIEIHSCPDLAKYHLLESETLTFNRDKKPPNMNVKH